MIAGYQILLPRHLTDDNAVLDAVVEQAVHCMQNPAGGFDPAIHELLSDTVEMRWFAYRLPRTDNLGEVIEEARDEPWQRGTPLPEWAQAVMLMASARVAERTRP